jgi:hypothetical protein
MRAPWQATLWHGRGLRCGAYRSAIVRGSAAAPAGAKAARTRPAPAAAAPMHDPLPVVPPPLLIPDLLTPKS